MHEPGAPAAVNKHDQRTVLRGRRKALVPQARLHGSKAIAQRLLSMNGIKKASSIGMHAGVGSEVQTLPVVRALMAEGRPVALPWLDGRLMVMRAVASLDDLKPGAFGVLEPPASAPAIEPAVVVVPGLGFTAQGHRLGQGAGHYDRYLETRTPRPVTIGLAFDEQIVDTLPIEPHDQRMDYIVTPTRLIDCRD